MAHAPLSTDFVTPCATHNQIGPLWCWFPSGWACAHSRPQWVSPTTSPVRLGVSPAAAPTPTALSVRGLRLYFPALERWVMQSASLPAVRPGLYVRECGAMGYYPSLCLTRSSHTPSVLVPPGQLESSLPRLPVSVPPTGLDECLFFIPLVSDFLAVRFSVSSGCARRRSVSTYAAILVLPNNNII